MKIEYKVRYYMDDSYEVYEIITTFGERISAYESEEDVVTETSVFKGDLANCESFIRLKEGNYL